MDKTTAGKKECGESFNLTCKIPAFRNSLSYTTRKNRDIIMIAIASLKIIQGNDNILMNILQVFCVRFLILEILHQPFRSKFLLQFINGLCHSISKTKKQKVIEIGDESLVQKRKRMHRAQNS